MKPNFDLLLLFLLLSISNCLERSITHHHSAHESQSKKFLSKSTIPPFALKVRGVVYSFDTTRLTGLEFLYPDTTVNMLSGTEEQHRSFMIKPDDIINKVDIYSDANFVNGLKFYTQNSNNSDLLGSSTGALRTFQCAADNQIFSFFANMNGSYLKDIDFTCASNPGEVYTLTTGKVITPIEGDKLLVSKNKKFTLSFSYWGDIKVTDLDGKVSWYLTHYFGQGSFKLILERDGDLVCVEERNNYVMWRFPSNWKGIEFEPKLIMQDYGDLCIGDKNDNCFLKVV